MDHQYFDGYRQAGLSEVRRKMTALNLDALIVSDLSAIRWLTGFSGSNARLLVSPDRCTLLRIFVTGNRPLQRSEWPDGYRFRRFCGRGRYGLLSVGCCYRHSVGQHDVGRSPAVVCQTGTNDGASAGRILLTISEW